MDGRTAPGALSPEFNVTKQQLNRCYPCLLLCSAVILAGCGKSGQQQQRVPEVGIVVVKAQPVTLTTELPARTDPYRTSNVEPQVTGILQKILFKEGGLVHAGQPLYQIDPAPYKAAYDSARAAVEVARANLADAKLKADRYAALRAQNAIAQQDADDAEAAYKQALATVEQNKANLESARINLGYTTITAPITGRIGRTLVTPGALVTANQTTPLATIATLDPIYVDMDQSSAELVHLEREAAEGQLSRRLPASTPVTLEMDDGSTYPLKGTLQFSEVTVDPTTGAVVLRAQFPNPDGLLLPGMYVRATIVEGELRNAILAPQQGVGRDTRGQPTALVVDAGGIVRLRQLVAPRTIGNDWLVTSGLHPGDRLIVEGSINAQPNMPARAVPAGSPPGAH